MEIISTHKIAFFSIAVGKDPVYFNSVQRYFPYNKENFGQDYDVDFYVFETAFIGTNLIANYGNQRKHIRIKEKINAFGIWFLGKNNLSNLPQSFFIVL
jgi:hypothetical protein